MKKIIDNIANWLVTLNEKKDKIDQSTATFMKRGKNAFMVWAIVFGGLFTFLCVDLYQNYGKLWLALIPMTLFVLFLFGVVILDSYRDKLKHRNRSSRMKLVGFNLDFTEHILKKIYDSLTRYEYLDENLTSFQNFYDVLVLDFDEHDSVLHFSCTQPQLKYILDKFKQFKKGIHLVSFERSQKVYHKGNLISAETLSKKYSDFPPGKEFEKLIDSFFDFLGEI